MLVVVMLGMIIPPQLMSVQQLLIVWMVPLVSTLLMVLSVSVHLVLLEMEEPVETAVLVRHWLYILLCISHHNVYIIQHQILTNVV